MCFERDTPGPARLCPGLPRPQSHASPPKRLEGCCGHAPGLTPSIAHIKHICSIICMPPPSASRHKERDVIECRVMTLPPPGVCGCPHVCISISTRARDLLSLLATLHAERYTLFMHPLTSASGQCRLWRGRSRAAFHEPVGGPPAGCTRCWRGTLRCAAARASRAAPVQGWTRGQWPTP